MAPLFVDGQRDHVALPGATPTFANSKHYENISRAPSSTGNYTNPDAAFRTHQAERLGHLRTLTETPALSSNPFLATPSQEYTSTFRLVGTQDHALQFGIGHTVTLAGNVLNPYLLGEGNTQIAAQPQSEPFLQAYNPQATFQGRNPQSFPNTFQAVVNIPGSGAGNLLNGQPFATRQELQPANQLHPPVTLYPQHLPYKSPYEPPQNPQQGTSHNDPSAPLSLEDIHLITDSIRELPAYLPGTHPPGRLEEARLNPRIVISRGSEPLQYETCTGRQSVLQGHLSSVAQESTSNPSVLLQPQILGSLDRPDLNAVGGFSAAGSSYPPFGQADPRPATGRSSLGSIQVNTPPFHPEISAPMLAAVYNKIGDAVPRQEPPRSNLGLPIIWTFVPVGHPQSRHFRRTGPARPLAAATSMQVQQGSENLVNDILQYAGLLLPNGRVDYSKLDAGSNIKPAFDKDPYAGLADSQVIVLSDSSDEEHMSWKSTTSAFSNMPPGPGNGHYLQNEVRHGGAGVGNTLRKANAVSKMTLDSTPRQPSSLRESTNEGNFSFAVVIPTPSPANSQSSMARTVYGDGEHADLDLMGENPFATRTSVSPVSSSNLRVEGHSPAAQAVLTHSSMTPNGKKRGRPFATPEAAAKAAAKLQRLAAQQAFTSQKLSSQPGSSKQSLSNQANSSENFTINNKKRGRPFQTPEAAAASAKAKAAKRARIERQGSAEPKKRGRPFTVNKEIEIPEGIYKPFICEWKDCPAELHNLDTLRQHLHIVHGGRNTTTRIIPCRWAKCAGKKVAEYRSRAKWKKHIEQDHLIPFSWHMGDGPWVGSLSSPSKKSLSQTDPWLFDTNGNQVTPSVQNQRLEAGRASFNNSRRFAKRKRHEMKSVHPQSMITYEGLESGLVSGAVNGGSGFKKTGFDIVLPPVISPHEYTVVHASDSEDELAPGGGGGLGSGHGHFAGDERAKEAADDDEEMLL